MKNSILTGVLAGLLLVSGVAQAQEAPAPAAGGQPELKRVDDWLVRCFPVQSPSPCDMMQELDDQRTRQRVVALSIAFYPSLNRHALQITVPLEISIQKGVKVQTDTYTSPVLKYRRCDRNGCYVEMAVDNAMIEALSGSNGGAKLIIAADNGKTYPLAFSLKGFSAAHDDMVAKAKAKAKPVSQDAAAAAAPPATP